MKYISVNANRFLPVMDKDNPKPTNRIITVVDTIDQNSKWNKAIDLYKEGKLFNVVLQGIGSIADFEISKNRIYSSESIVDAYESYKQLITEYPYYRIMFDSHPTTEGDESPDMGEGNTYDNIGGYILKLYLKDIKINNNIHKAIVFDYVISKKQILSYFLGSIDPIIAISHRGFMGNIQQYPREDIMSVNNNITFMKDVFKSLDFWNKDSEYIDYVGFLRLLGFDMVTYPADFLCVSRKQDIIGCNISDYGQTSVDNDHINENSIVYSYMVDRCVKVSSPYSLALMQKDDMLIRNYVRSEKVLDEAKFILSNNREVSKMKINLEQLKDKEYMQGIFNDLDNMLTDLNGMWEHDRDSVGTWIGDLLNDEFKEKFAKDEEFTGSVKILMDNFDNFSDVFEEWTDSKLTDHNKEIIQVMVDAIGVDNFKTFLESDFKVSDEDVKTILGSYKEEENFNEITESISENLKLMADDAEYFKNLATEIITVSGEGEVEVTATTDSEEKVDETVPVELEPAVDAVTFSDTVSEAKWDSGPVEKTVGEVVQGDALDDDQKASVLNEVYAIVRCADKRICQKLPHHEVSVDGNGNVTATLSKAGVIAAVQSILGARSKLVASKEEKSSAAKHLMGHYQTLEMEAPEGLKKVAENAKFADLVIDDDFALTLDDLFIDRIINEDEYLSQELTLDSQEDIPEILDSVYNIIKPFVNEGAQITVDENMFKRLAYRINQAAVNLAAVLNGDEEINTTTDALKMDAGANEEFMTGMRNQIDDVKSKYSELKDQNIVLSAQNTELQNQLKEFENRASMMTSSVENAENIQKTIDEMNKLAQAKLSLVFSYKGVIDEDIFNEVLASRSIEQLVLVEKWVSKMSNKRVVVNELFSNKLEREPATVIADAEPIQTTINATLLQKPRVTESEEKDRDVIQDILKLIKS